MNEIKTEIALIFDVWGDSFSVKDLSETIGIMPGKSQKTEVFSYQIGYENTLFVEDLTDKFIEVFSPKINELADYIRKHQLETRVEIVVYQNEEESTPALFFDEEFIRLIAKLNAGIDIDLYR